MNHARVIQGFAILAVATTGWLALRIVNEGAGVIVIAGLATSVATLIAVFYALSPTGIARASAAVYLAFLAVVATWRIRLAQDRGGEWDLPRLLAGVLVVVVLSLLLAFRPDRGKPVQVILLAIYPIGVVAAIVANLEVE